MKTITVKKLPNTFSLKVWINKVELIFDADGKCSENLDNGNHIISWSIISKEGTEYSVNISEKDSVIWEYHAKLDDEGKDAGSDDFKIGGLK